MDHESVLQAVRKLYSSMEWFDANAATKLDIDRTSLRAINALERGPLSPAELGSILALTSGSVTALLDRLEKAGHVERIRSKKDGRRSEVKLSKKTRSKAHSHYNQLGKAISAKLASKKSSELKLIAATLESLSGCFAGKE